ncbi:uncharacterized protein LOC128226617 isoform X2 [Mya arenaria]|uniref:uncharacterized protein LOC128226617 isoform X2 n=1 Tax=Mya arenaria TaxID=6604 RepID=UPI0022E2F2B1|nr:uncharacterized protein LOC128226617 isoform X2 [Mya arenaria]
MTSTRKSSVTWKIPSIHRSQISPRTHRKDVETPSDLYEYSNTFEESSHEGQPDYSNTFVEDSYSDTFISGSSQSLSKSHSESRKGNYSHGSSLTGQIKHYSNAFSSGIKPKKDYSVSFEDSDTSIQEVTHLETAKNVTDVLETVHEVESRTEDFEHSTDSDQEISDTHPPETYTDTFESDERTMADTPYDTTETSDVQKTSYSETYFQSLVESTYSEEDSLLDHSFIAPDRNCKSLTDEEDETDVEDSYKEDFSYSYTFEPTETVTSHAQTRQSQLSIEEEQETEFVKRKFMRKMVEKMKQKSDTFKKMETLPAEHERVPEDDYLRHFCKKKIKMLKTRRKMGKVAKEEPVEAQVVTKDTMLADYGIPESVMERLRIKNIISAMEKAANEPIHEPRKCPQCSYRKTDLDTEDAERKFVTAQTMRLKNKIMDNRVEEHIIKMNTVSLVAELARDLPRHSEKPEKILDKLLEPLLGKNVMR